MRHLVVDKYERVPGVINEDVVDFSPMFVTLPRGWNAELDRFISEGRIPFVERRCLKRISADNRWEEADCLDLDGIA